MRGRQTAASRAKAATLKTLKRDLGKEKIGHLDRQKLIDYGKMRAEQGAGPVTLGIDIGVIKMIINHAAAARGHLATAYREFDESSSGTNLPACRSDRELRLS